MQKPTSNTLLTMSTSATATATATAIFLFLFLAPSFAKPPRPFNKIYAFGDSYTDTGNTASGTGPRAFPFVSSLPYGRTFFHHPTNRYSDGRLVIDFVAESLSLPYLQPYLHRKSDTSAGINYAVAGSTAIRHAFFVKNNLTFNTIPQSLQTELAWFSKTLEEQNCENAISTPEKCAAVFRDALVWVGSMGVNDYGYALLGSGVTGGPTVSGDTVQRKAIRSVTGFIEAVLNKGAKYVVVQGLPASGCLSLTMYLSSPEDRDDMGCVATANNQSYIHNTILQTNIQNLRRRYPKSIIVYADYWNAYQFIIKNAPKLGFHELYKTCCGSGGGPYNYDLMAPCGSQSGSSCKNPSNYINWDGAHLTEAMYKVLTKMFLNDAFTHPPFKSLLAHKQNST